MRRSYEDIVKLINKDWANVLRSSVKKAQSINKTPKLPCEQCGRPVYRTIDFLCSDECAEKYWKIK